jgi:hypothetical protein
VKAKRLLLKARLAETDRQLRDLREFLARFDPEVSRGLVQPVERLPDLDRTVARLDDYRLVKKQRSSGQQRSLGA